MGVFWVHSTRPQCTEMPQMKHYGFSWRKNPSTGPTSNFMWMQKGSYLSAVPSSINGSTLWEMEFQDIIRTRAALPPLNLHLYCNECGENFTITHAHSCKNGGNIIACHNEIVSELVSLSTMAFKPSAVQAEPKIQTGCSITTNSDSDSTVETSDRGDVLVPGRWPNGQDAILNIRVTDTDQASYVTRDPEKVLQSHEKEEEEKKKYLLLY